MLYIQARDISFGYPNNYKNILESITFNFLSTSKVGLVGKNGCGKSTLLKIILEQLKNYTGHLFLKEELKIGYLPQEINLEIDLNVEDYFYSKNTELFELKKKIESIDSFSEEEISNILLEFEEKEGYIFQTKLAKILSDFKLSEQKEQKISELSGGEKTKLALASVINSDPDILLLDEPTNHLDIIYLEWLENYLKHSSIPFIIISHDRKFLDKCVNSIWEINTSLTEYTGNYSFYKHQKELELSRKIEEYEIQQKKNQTFRICFIKEKE